MCRFILTSLFIIFTTINACAINGVKYISINNHDGLSHNTVRCIMQDKKGFIWISTMNGLNRYDGNDFIVMQPEFETPSITENTIKKTIEDNHGHIWILSTSDIVDCYDTHTESFIDYTEGNDAKEYSNILMTSDNDIWLYGKKYGAKRIKYVVGKQYFVDFDNENIHSNVISFVYEDSINNIWIGTDRDLYKVANDKLAYCITGDNNKNFKTVAEANGKMYFFTEGNTIVVLDRSKNKYSEQIEISSDSKLIKINSTVTIDNDKILIATDEGLKILDTQSNKISDANRLFGGVHLNNAHTYIDNIKGCWVYNNTGVVWHYDKNKKRFIRYELIPPAILPLIDIERYNLHVDSKDISWITTYGNGLFGIDTKTGEITHITTDNSELQTNYLLSVSEDRDGNIWVGTEFTGVVKLSFPKNKDFTFFPNAQKGSAEDKIIRSVYEDYSGNLWVGTKSGNLYVYNAEKKPVETIHLSKGAPYIIEQDSDSNIWVGTKGGGLLCMQKNGNSHTIKTYDTNSKPNINSNNIYSFIFDSKKRMWIGTYGGGLLLGEKKNGEYWFRSFTTIEAVQDKIRCIIEDKDGNIWIGGNDGLIKIDPDKFIHSPKEYTLFEFDKNNSCSLSNNEIKALYEDIDGNIWLGTSGSGISCMQKDASNKVKFKHYSTKDGLINNVVQSITGDNYGNIWISTEAGLSKLDRLDMIFKNFNMSDVWSENLFCESAAARMKNGNLIFGSHNGLYIFNPEEIVSDQASSPIMITGLMINGNPVTPNVSNSPLTKSISETKLITLNHRQTTFSIDFSSLKFNGTNGDRYTYILENFDQDWNPVTSHNVATYRNVPPGEYTFKVKSYYLSEDAEYKETSLDIIINPPFWKSWQAFLLYFVVLIMACYISVKLVSKMNKLNNEVHIEKQLTEYKLRFFTNISHEFRTPLTIIRASIESMKNISPLPTKLKRKLSILDRSSSRLMKLIDQLLEFRKLQNNQLDLCLEYVSIESFFENIHTQFEEIAVSNDISYMFVCDNNISNIPLDTRKTDKIVFNLLSNAFRNTPKGGKIRLKLVADTENDKFIFSVSDSGPGVPSDKIDLLFERFKPIGNSDSGMGIGLNLTQELVNIHKGNIEYANSEWNGASFVVTLPLSEAQYGDVDIVEQTDLGIDTSDRQIVTDLEDYVKDIIPNHKLDYSILVVEDDNEIRNFLNEQLEAYFTIHTAEDGISGLEKANNEHVDLIICDVMMPGMDGFELTNKLKSNFETSHIPVILLTAYSSTENRVEGIEAGADSYITKPFSLKYLLSRVIKLIEQREKLKQKMSKGLGMFQPTITTVNKDKEFIEKVNTTIEKELANSKFTVETFAKSLNLSRTLFYKKTKSLTGYSPNEYIRVIRLNKAAEMLKTTTLNISEVAYSVGFNDPFYFSKCFKEQFKINPSHYRQNGGVKSANDES